MPFISADQLAQGRSPLIGHLREFDRAEAGGFRMSPIVMRASERILACAAILRATAILFQCPASFRPTEDNIDRLRAFFETVQRPSGVRMMREPRGPWPSDVVKALCQELDLVHVVDPFVTTTETPDQTYLRLHGTTGTRHVYSDGELVQLADMLPAAPSHPPYVLFNKLPRVEDARRFWTILANRRS